MVPIDRSQVPGLLRRAQELHRAGDLPGAQALYLQLAEMLPESAELRHLLGVVAYQRGDAAGAIGHYRRALGLRAHFPQAHNNLGIAQKAIGANEEAARSFEAALAADPGYGEAAYNLALLHEASGHADLAVAAYRRALAIRPDWPEALGNLGNFLRLRERLDEAEPLLERAAEVRPADATALGNLALLRLDQARYAEARGLAEAAAALAPDAPQWWSAAGSAARLMLDAEGATAHLERAAALSLETGSCGWRSDWHARKPRTTKAPAMPSRGHGRWRPMRRACAGHKPSHFRASWRMPPTRKRPWPDSIPSSIPSRNSSHATTPPRSPAWSRRPPP